MTSRFTRPALLTALLLSGAVTAGCNSTDYHGPAEANDGGRGGDMHYPAGVSAGDNETAGYAGDPPALHPQRATTPEVPTQDSP